jgi:tetratricopeptide (TPR) repeat protein
VRLAEAQGDNEWRNRTLTWLYQTQAMAAWLRGDVEQTYARIGEARKLMAVFTSPALPGDLSFGYFALGKFVEADAMLKQSPLAEQKAHWNLWLAILSGDSASIPRFAAEAERFPFFDTPRAQALAHVGRFAAVEKMLAGYRQPVVGILPQSVAAVRGELAFRRGRVRESIEILRQFLADVNTAGLYEQLPAARTLAQAYLIEGQQDLAIQALEKATAEPRLCNDFDRAVFWPFARFDLLRLYRAAGRHKEAAALHLELAKLLRLADPGHVLLTGLRQDASSFPTSLR